MFTPEFAHRLLEHYINVDRSQVAAAMTRHPLANRGINPRLVEMVRGGLD